MLYFIIGNKNAKEVYKNMKSKANLSAAVFCVLLMLITGASDALKGVFLPQFKSSFSLSGSQSSRIIMMCYVGNLLFLFIGGYFADRLPRKRFVGAVMLMWMSSLAAYVFTESYAVLLVAMIFSMGASTMLSTSVNLITPLIFAAPAFYVNIFNFCQGAGITASQNLGGRFADKLSGWHAANAILLALAAVCFVLLMTLKLPDPDPSAADKSPVSSYKSVLKNPAFFSYSSAAFITFPNTVCKTGLPPTAANISASRYLAPLSSSRCFSAE